MLTRNYGAPSSYVQPDYGVTGLGFPRLGPHGARCCLIHSWYALFYGLALSEGSCWTRFYLTRYWWAQSCRARSCRSWSCWTRSCCARYSRARTWRTQCYSCSPNFVGLASRRLRLGRVNNSFLLFLLLRITIANELRNTLSFKQVSGLRHCSFKIAQVD